jgi:uncharacterized protein YggU (UPF0235/DUF167 family)
MTDQENRDEEFKRLNEGDGQLRLWTAVAGDVGGPGVRGAEEQRRRIAVRTKAPPTIAAANPLW